MDLAQSKLEVKVKIMQANGNDLGAAAKVGPVNDILNILFQSVEMEIGGVFITDPNTRYGYKSVFENFINYD